MATGGRKGERKKHDEKGGEGRITTARSERANFN
jgi:hypothetical protein